MRSMLLAVCVLFVGCASPSSRDMFELQRDVTNLGQRVQAQDHSISELRDQIAALRGEYVIKPGDSARKIAAQFGTTVDHLQQLNPWLEANKLRIGDVIKIK